MFANPKAQKLYQSHQESNNEELVRIDEKLGQENGASYQQALYTDFNNENVCFVPFGYDYEFAPIYAIYGCFLEEEDLGLVRLHLVKTIQEQVLDKKENQRGISLVYFGHANLKHKTQPKYKRKAKKI